MDRAEQQALLKASSEQPGGLGRLYIPDDRDMRFLMAGPVERRAEDQPERRYRYWWPSGWWGNQGGTPQCVAYSWMHWIEDGPITHAPRAPGEGPVLGPHQLYKEAQQLDEWPGENYAGTSVRGGAKALQRRGLIGPYRWGFTLDDLVMALLYAGPVVLGTWWYRDMGYPDADGLIRVGGPRVGGHAYLANGINLDRDLIRIKNSWGRSWGVRGYAWITLGDAERLIAEQGEVCLAEEVDPRVKEREQ